jgi:hypothetical protein
MKHQVFQLAIFISVVASSCQSQKANNEHNHDSTASSDIVPADTIKKSIPKQEHAQVGSAHLMIKYHAPTVRGRTIWGGLVPFGDVWVTGAHSATLLEVDKALLIGDTQLPPGKYALFTIPGKDKWTIIVNKNWDQHLADEYDQKDDVLRLDVTPEQLENIQERLKYTINSTDDTSGTIDISWEKVKVKLPFKISS